MFLTAKSKLYYAFLYLKIHFSYKTTHCWDHKPQIYTIYTPKYNAFYNYNDRSLELEAAGIETELHA